MIGREDVVIEAPRQSPAELLDAVARTVLHRWGKAIFQDAELGKSYAHFGDIPFGRVHELLVYRDKAAFESWESLGADPSNAGTMIHLVASPGQLTVVVDDQNEPIARSVISEARSLVIGLPGRVYAAFGRAA